MLIGRADVTALHHVSQLYTLQQSLSRFNGAQAVYRPQAVRNSSERCRMYLYIIVHVS
ncbi:MAG: hypothetical protein AVDCRST_MAG93-10096 [uncultured Chloroflexia bacterium]|uniref:Uncharacterized protein n=1 Tax=uncultured Chloroflexia bacterium TaxID=1672391 RepID=A0A6J4NUB3_9CHLR|nr:MAG: hypothetical protein AVDCRST_MAG93-10096 [uncultured Chloroflexia bacterium]